MTISKSSKTITGNFGTGSGFPSTASTENPFKIQVAGSNFNDGVYTVISNTGTVLTLLERPTRNEVSAFVVALSNITWTITYSNQDTNSLSYVGSATAYMRHYDTSGQCVANLNLVGNPCEEGWAKASGYFNAQSYCTWNSTSKALELPCEVQAFAGNGQLANFVFDAGNNNFSNCTDPNTNGSLECHIAWSDPDKVNSGICKKYFLANDTFQECQTLKFTIIAGTGISNFWHRAWNSEMTSADPVITADHQTLTAAQSSVSVAMEANPNPVQVGNSSSSTITIKIQNSSEANLGLIDVNSVKIVFRNAQGRTAEVFNNKAPTSCTDGNCWNFKFGRDDLFCAYASIYPDSVEQDGLLTVGVITLPLVGNYPYPNDNNGIEGTTDLHVNGSFDTSTQCPAP